MSRRKKPFIDKKHATTYRLIPGYVPETIEENNIFVTGDDREKRKEEQRKYGIFYEDDYDYMRHLRSLKEEAALVKVSDMNKGDDEVRSSYGGSVASYGGSINFRMFQTTVVEKEEHIDPDILAAMDEAKPVNVNEDGDMEVEGDDDFLEDDFINQAGGYEPKLEKEDYYSNQDYYMEDQDLGSDFEGLSEDGSFSGYEEDDHDFDDRHEKPKGRGNAQDDFVEAQTALILKNFEEGMGFSTVAQHLDEDEGRATAEDYENLKEILLQDKITREKKLTFKDIYNDRADRPHIDTSKYSEEQEEDFEWRELPPTKPKFDCVSILSLNSNTRNLPTDIIPPSLQKKRSKTISSSETNASGDNRGLSQREIEEEMRLSRKADQASTFRPKDETPEERKDRKKALKEERKERRQEKKANKIVFAMEKQQMDREVAAAAKTGKGSRLT